MTDDRRPSRPSRVLVAGAGVAALEALIALRRLAGDRVAVTLLAPDEAFAIRALSVERPFDRPEPRRYPLARICADFGAEHRRDALHAVRREYGTVRTASGDDVGFDALLVAVGAQPSPVFPGALTFRGLQDAATMREVLRDVEAGAVTRLAFVVPSAPSWSLPLYELALLTAERAEATGAAVQITIVTPESAPLGLFGLEASRHVDELLAARGIVVRTSCHARSVEGGVVEALPGRVEVRADRVITSPRLNGPCIAGLPSDRDGFLPVDDFARVAGTSGVFAAGDCTTMPIKQGGVAAQHALVAARSVARLAGAGVAPAPFRPVLRGKLVTGGKATYLKQEVAGGAGDGSSVAAEHALWWPPAKVAAPHLSAYLAAVDDGMPFEDAVTERPVHAAGDPAGGIEVL